MPVCVQCGAEFDCKKRSVKLCSDDCRKKRACWFAQRWREEKKKVLGESVASNEQKKRLATGKCRLCNEPLASKSYCARHLAEKTAKNLGLYHRYAEDRRCGYCGQPVTGRWKTCESCREIYAARMRQRRMT